MGRSCKQAPKNRVQSKALYPSFAAEEEHIKGCEQRCMDDAPPLGESPGVDDTYAENPVAFATLPLSQRSMAGLKDGKFTDMTRIQAAALPHALARRDILGAAKTGSGKTLSFTVPALEMLWRERWSSDEGLGALVISPTRELAMQIFDVLREVGGVVWWCV